jgi:hypothetical protein
MTALWDEWPAGRKASIDRLRDELSKLAVWRIALNAHVDQFKRTCGLLGPDSFAAIICSRSAEILEDQIQELDEEQERLEAQIEELEMAQGLEDTRNRYNLSER